MVRAPSNFKIIPMTSNLKNHDKNRKEYRKKYLGNITKIFCSF